jgi:hypothetical protein
MGAIVGHGYGSGTGMDTFTLDENQWKKFQLKKLNNKKFFSCPNWGKKMHFGT